jgi:hypothetical protein
MARRPLAEGRRGSTDPKNGMSSPGGPSVKILPTEATGQLQSYELLLNETTTANGQDDSQPALGQRYEEYEEQVACCRQNSPLVQVGTHGEEAAMHMSLEDNVGDQCVQGRRDESLASDSTELEQLVTPRFSGEMFQTALGHLQGIYTWECDHFPSEDEIREGMCVRVVRDCSRYRKRDRCTELTGWHGGRTREGIGIFTTDVRSRSFDNRTRQLGRATVRVRTPGNSGSRTWNGIAC